MYSKPHSGTLTGVQYAIWKYVKCRMCHILVILRHIILLTGSVTYIRPHTGTLNVQYTTYRYF